MIEGSYGLTAQTPLGLKRGKITFDKGRSDTDQGRGIMKVRLDISGFRVMLTRAQIAENDFVLDGKISHLLGSASFVCKGSVQDSSLTAIATSGDISIDIKGTRLS